MDMQRFARVTDGIVAEIIELPLVVQDLVTGEDGEALLDADGAFQYRNRPLVPGDVCSTEVAAQMHAAPVDVESGWRFDGTTWSPPAPVAPLPVVVPQLVTMRQARLAMLGAGILDDVEDTISAMPGDAGKAARIEWEYAATLRRGHPLVVGLGPALELTAEAIDALFVAAAAIPE